MVGIHIDYIELGNRVCELRESMGLSQEKFAEKCNISRVTVSNIENANTKASAENLNRIARACNVTVDYLQYGSQYSVCSEIACFLPGEQKFINQYRKLSPEDKQKMSVMIETLFPYACV